VLGDTLAWVCLAVFVAPGWFAVRGWYAGRGEPALQPLVDWLPLALAISVAWSGTLVMSGGAAGVAAIVRGGAPAVRVAALLVLLIVLWLAPFGSGWALARWTRRRRRRWAATIVLKSGATLSGTLHHNTANEVALTDAVVDGRRDDLLTVNRADVELFMRSWGEVARVGSSRRERRNVRRGRQRDRAAGDAHSESETSH
jgi:hypothetical protein